MKQGMIVAIFPMMVTGVVMAMIKRRKKRDAEHEYKAKR
jgi:methionine aminopeptidase